MFISTALAATAATQGAEHGDKSGSFPPFDPATFSSQLLWLAITFGFFYFIMARVALPRIGTTSTAITSPPTSVQAKPTA